MDLFDTNYRCLIEKLLVRSSRSIYCHISDSILYTVFDKVIRHGIFITINKKADTNFMKNDLFILHDLDFTSIIPVSKPRYRPCMTLQNKESFMLFILFYPPMHRKSGISVASSRGLYFIFGEK